LLEKVKKRKPALLDLPLHGEHVDEAVVLVADEGELLVALHVEMLHLLGVGRPLVHVVRLHLGIETQTHFTK